MGLKSWEEYGLNVNHDRTDVHEIVYTDHNSETIATLVCTNMQGTRKSIFFFVVRTDYPLFQQIF
jgi:hypothetical protein